MHSLLIVDDENYVIEDIKNSFRWNEIGISDVFAACNVFQAQQVFMQHDISILLCDIEMPGGNGLELLSWVRRNHPKTETVFLTCHADFAYAKQAIRLGCYDYLLKPVVYEELKAVLAKLLGKIEKTTETQEASGDFRMIYQPLLLERFWLDVINREIPPDPDSFSKAADKRMIPFSPDIPITPLLICVQRWHSKQSLQEEKTMEFGLKNIAGEMFAGENKNGLFIQIRRGELLGILVEPSETRLEAECERYIEICNQNLSCDLSCYLSSGILPNELADAVERLIETERDNVAYYNKVFRIEKDAGHEAAAHNVDMNVWANLLEDGKTAAVVSGAETYLNRRIREKDMDYRVLYQFQQDFSQMIYSSLSGKGIAAHQLFGDKTSIELNQKAVHSVSEMVDWIQYVVNKAVNYSTEVEKSQTVVSKLQKYLNANLNQELTRDSIASMVYLNPDYLDRMFKKETGVTAARYLTNERVAAAKRMLSQTDLPINQIAESVGYSKLSNFSAMFKKMCGVTPFMFRKISQNHQ